MADMPISREDFNKLPSQTDEERVRGILEREFEKRLPKKRVKLGNITHEFDLFANDGSIMISEDTCWTGTYGLM